MTCQEIINILERQSPPEYALEWDNVGLLVGRRDREIKKIMLAVDATNDVCQEAIDQQVDMIITHHPMIFRKIKRVNDDTVIGRKIMSLIESGICLYAMHTNFDTKGGMGTEAANMLELQNVSVLEETKDGEGVGRIGFLKEGKSTRELALFVKERFGLESVSVFGDLNREVEKIAVCPGSGKSVIDISLEKGVEVLITGDIGHHEGIDANDAGLSIIDASHYGIEKIFLKYMEHYLKDYMNGIEIVVNDVGVPFTIV